MRNILRTLQRTRLSHSPALDAFFPNIGRRLWNELRKQQEHTRTFNLRALADVVIKAAGSRLGTAHVRLEKLAEGASNKVFLAFVGKQRFIVKIPDPVVPPRLVTASEVATLSFLRSELNLPVPRVVSWSDSSDNPVGCEYIIMEEAHGRPLNTVWSSLDIPDKFAVVDEVLSIQKRLIATRNIFSGYGSLYFAGDAAKLGISHHLPVQSSRSPKILHRPTGTPTLHWTSTCSLWGRLWSLQVLWGRHDCLVAYQLGRNPQDYLNSIARSSMAQIVTHQDQYATADRAFSFPVNTESDTSASAVSDMLKTLYTVIPYMVPRSASQNQPLLWHKDLHFGNLFVSTDGKVSYIVDWQDTNILSTFLAARIPQFVHIEDNALLLKLPRTSQSMLQQYYLADLRECVPGLAALLEDIQLAPIRKQVELFSRMFSRQDIDALFLRETLLRIQRHWPNLLLKEDITVQCPIKIEGDELINYQRDGRRYNEFQDLLKDWNIPVADQGWVPADEFTERQIDLKIAIRKTIESLECRAEQHEFENRLRHWNLTDWYVT